MKSMVTKRRGLAVFRGPLIGVILFAALSFLAAELTERGIIPMEAAAPALLISMMLAAVFAGAFSGGAGKRGLFTGGVLAIVYLIGKAAFHADAFFDVGTLLGLLCSLLPAWVSSCIFHKKGGCYTKCNRKNRKRNYK